MPSWVGATFRVVRCSRRAPTRASSSLTAAETDELIRSVAGVFDWKTMRVGQAYRIERGADGRVQAFRLVVTRSLTIRAARGPAGALVGVADHS